MKRSLFALLLLLLSCRLSAQDPGGSWFYDPLQAHLFQTDTLHLHVRLLDSVPVQLLSVRGGYFQPFDREEIEGYRFKIINGDRLLQGDTIRMEIADNLLKWDSPLRRGWTGEIVVLRSEIVFDPYDSYRVIDINAAAEFFRPAFLDVQEDFRCCCAADKLPAHCVLPRKKLSRKMN